MPQSPSFTRSTTGLGKETTIGVPVVPTLWVSAQDVTMTGTNSWFERSGARGQVGMEVPLTGTFGGAGSFTIETDPDVIGAPLAWAMGTEAVAVNATLGNPAAGATVNTTLSAAAAAGATTIAVTAATNISAGVAFVLDPLGIAPEAVVVASISGTTVTLTAALAYSHASGAAVVAATAYDHTLTLGIPRPTFTLQNNTQTDVVSYYGNKVADWTMALNPRQLVAVGFRTTYVSEGIDTAGTPAFSALKPYKVLDAGNAATLNGSAVPAGILTLSISVNNGLQASEYAIGQGRLVNSLPEGQSRVTGSGTLQFTSNAFRKIFWGNALATGPQSEVIASNLQFTLLSPSYVNGVVRYGLKIILPRVKLSTAPTTGRSGGLITQNFSFVSAQSAPNASDDISCIVTNASSVAA